MAEARLALLGGFLWHLLVIQHQFSGPFESLLCSRLRDNDDMVVEERDLPQESGDDGRGI